MSTADSNVTWTSPADGMIDISGAVWLARDIGRAVDWDLRINGASVSGGSLVSGDIYSRLSPFALDTGTGGALPLSDVLVNSGDVVGLYFITIGTYGDFTGVDLQIDLTPTSAPVPEPASLTLLGVGLVGVVATRVRKRRNAA